MNVQTPRLIPRKGRGAASQPEGRFDATRTEAVDDGWDTLAHLAVPESVATELRPEKARTLITRNESPDIPFDQSINPYRGCEHGCPYCVSPDTAVLMADGAERAIADVRVGDAIVGTCRTGHNRRFALTRVNDQWITRKPAWRIELADGTVLVAGADHRFMTDRGWTFVARSETERWRPVLTVHDSLLGFGALRGVRSSVPSTGAMPPDEFARGYLTGLIRGYGHFGEYDVPDTRSSGQGQGVFRLALGDIEASVRAQQWLLAAGIETRKFAFFGAGPQRPQSMAIRTNRQEAANRLRALVKWPSFSSSDWKAGFLGGLFDAEGGFSGGLLSLTHTDPAVLAEARGASRSFGFDIAELVSRRIGGKDGTTLSVRGGLREALRFFRLTDPAIARKRSIAGLALKSTLDLRVVSIERLPGLHELVDISTGTEDFIANGVVSHNCYARPSHAYVGLSPGLDFETKIYFKQDAVKLLEGELAKPSYVPSKIMLGANTDPYQPAERRLQITRGILETFVRTRHPVGVVTKGALVLRDLDLLSDLARDRLVQVMISLPTLRDDLKRTLEPRAASPRARLIAIERLATAGVPVGVLVAPVIPVLTDPEIESVLEAAAKAGATSASYVLLRLPYEVAPLFREWLSLHAPDQAAHVMARVQDMRAGRDNDPGFGTRMSGRGIFADLIRQRFKLALRRLGLAARDPLPLDTTQFVRPAGPGGSGQLSLGW